MQLIIRDLIYRSPHESVYDDMRDFRIEDVVDYLDRHAELYLTMDGMIRANQK